MVIYLKNFLSWPAASLRCIFSNTKHDHLFEYFNPHISLKIELKLQKIIFLVTNFNVSSVPLSSGQFCWDHLISLSWSLLGWEETKSNWRESMVKIIIIIMGGAWNQCCMGRSNWNYGKKNTPVVDPFSWAASHFYLPFSLVNWIMNITHCNKHAGKNCRIWSQTASVHVQVPTWTSCVTLGKLFNFSEPYFLSVIKWG